VWQRDSRRAGFERIRRLVRDVRFDQRQNPAGLIPDGGLVRLPAIDPAASCYALPAGSARRQ